MSIPFSDIPAALWNVLYWFLGVEGVPPPNALTVIDAVTHGLMHPSAVNWFHQQHKVVQEGSLSLRVGQRTVQVPRKVEAVAPESAGLWGRTFITSHGRTALQWRAEQESAAERGKRRPGRPKKTEKDSATFVVAALNKWHGYEGGCVTNYEPASNRGLADLFNKGSKHKDYRLSENALSRFLKERFPGEEKPHKKYKVACHTETIDTLLALWNRELPARHAELRDDD
ncbi:MAG: hypothetical protein HYS12_00460 [Planctomycetes bacterium]|nr:hypothetical protein [Planctomycetota bacterium]